jgi:hypothetical protein
MIAALQKVDDLIQNSTTKSAYKATVELVSAPYGTASKALLSWSQTDLGNDIGSCLDTGTRAEKAYNKYIAAESDDWSSGNDRQLQTDWRDGETLLQEVQGSLPDGPVSAPAARKVTVTGSGSRNSKKFILDGGDYNVTFTGSEREPYPYDNVAMQLYRTDGTYIALVVNKIVKRNGTWKYTNHEYGLGPGAYYLVITAPGSWKAVFAPE